MGRRYFTLTLVAALVVFAGIPVAAHSAPQATAPAQAAAAAAAEPTAPGFQWIGPDGKPLPFKSPEEMIEFLRTGEVKSEKTLTGGVTFPIKMLLEKDGIQANAVFRDVNEDKTVQTFSTGHSELFFRDSYIFEPAAYEMARMLGLDNVPPTVLRKHRGKSGSIQAWVENATTELKRVKENIQPPDMSRWNKQTQMMNVFDALVLNTDRNRGNVLFTPDWKLWMIDHTRAFRRQKDLPQSNALSQCERGMFEKLKGLDEKVVRERLKDYLKGPEIDGLLARRLALIKRIEKAIAEKGEEKVLYTFTSGTVDSHQPVTAE